MKRPLGVTIIAILTAIVGIASFIAGVSLVILGIYLSMSNSQMSTDSNPLGSVFGVLSAGVGSVWLEIGIGYIIMSYGLFKSKGWAWTITIILSIISIAISIIFGITGGVLNLSSANTMNGSNSLMSGIIVTIIGIAVDIVIIYYLCRPHVKAFFGKTVPYKI
ncbi:MAG: hypothetical protein WBQ16_12000 [Nitrososphaeraceae archaeon]